MLFPLPRRRCKPYLIFDLSFRCSSFCSSIAHIPLLSKTSPYSDTLLTIYLCRPLDMSAIASSSKRSAPTSTPTLTKRPRLSNSTSYADDQPEAELDEAAKAKIARKDARVRIPLIYLPLSSSISELLVRPFGIENQPNGLATNVRYTCRLSRNGSWR